MSRVRPQTASRERLVSGQMNSCWPLMWPKDRTVASVMFHAPFVGEHSFGADHERHYPA